MSWKQLVSTEGITGSSSFTDWAGKDVTHTNISLLRGDVTGSIIGSQLPTNWEEGT